MVNLLTYKDGEPFPGVVGRTSAESSPAWPTPPRAPEGAPNPSHTLGVVDDPWSRRISDSGLPNAIPGRGGHYVLLPLL